MRTFHAKYTATVTTDFVSVPAMLSDFYARVFLFWANQVKNQVPDFSGVECTGAMLATDRVVFTFKVIRLNGKIPIPGCLFYDVVARSYLTFTLCKKIECFPCSFSS